MKRKEKMEIEKVEFIRVYIYFKGLNLLAVGGRR